MSQAGNPSENNSEKIKNIIVVYDYAYINGGAAKVAIQGAVGLSSRYHVCYFAGVGPICDELAESNVEVQCLNINDINSGSRIKAIINGIWNVTAQRKFRNLLSQYDPQNTVVHIHGWVKALSSSVVHVSTKCGFRTVITLHDYFTICPNGGLYDYKKGCICKIGRYSPRCLACNCDKRNYVQKIWRCLRQTVQDKVIRRNKNIFFVPVSSPEENVIRPFVRSSKFRMVTNPVQLSEGKNQNIADSFIYLFVGRLSEEKGIELFCEAIRRTKNNHSFIRGVVVGDGPLMNQLSAKYTEIEFLGWQSPDNVQKYLSDARVLVFPSKWYEAAAPLTVIEALSCGLPCIIADCSFARDVIQNGVNGMVFRSDSVEELASCIERSLDNRMMQEMHQNIVDGFDASLYTLESHVRNLCHMYEIM